MAHTSPTRMELARLRKKLIVARRGHKLLKNKRDELIREFLVLARENKKCRQEVEEKIKKAYHDFALARASMSQEALRTALMAPRQEMLVNVAYNNVMSVKIPRFEANLENQSKFGRCSYGFAFTSVDLDTAIASIGDVMENMVYLAQCEKSCEIMSNEIEKVRRRVNALEYMVIPEAESSVKYILMKLAENERSNQVRFMKVKEMILNKKMEAILNE